MSIPVYCYMCRKVMFNNGGLVISPPLFQLKADTDNCNKLNICKDDYKKVKEFLDEARKEVISEYKTV